MLHSWELSSLGDGGGEACIAVKEFGFNDVHVSQSATSGGARVEQLSELLLKDSRLSGPQAEQSVLAIKLRFPSLNGS